MQAGIPYKNYPVLFVDDEELALLTFKSQFRRNFTVYTANSGSAALELLREHPEIAAIVTDQRMPGMTGTELLGRVQEVAPDMVRMLITAYSDMDAVIAAINVGNVYRYITKPYHDEDLRGAILQGIERYHLIRERDRLYAEKIETLKKVARSNRLTAIGTLAAGMAHEINNPLTAIITFFQMLPRKLEEPERDPQFWDHLYRLTIKETERIRTLVGQLLTFSRTAGQEDLVLREVEINKLVEEVVLFLTGEARKKEIEFELLLMPELPAVKADPEKIRQVLLNLILNAIQATAGGTITIATNSSVDERGQPYLELVVADTGVGISEENLQKLFNPFFTTKEGEGTGLGLMTCHHIIDQHRGAIDVRSEVGKGTSVIVQLPLDPSKHERRTVDRPTGT